MCKVILRNDYWCKGLGQTQPKSEAYCKFKEIQKRKREIAKNKEGGIIKCGL
jgi:predicted phosphoadenosine phosphosulfate sulfurtransferase